MSNPLLARAVAFGLSCSIPLRVCPQGQTILLVDDSENDLALMRIAFNKAKWQHSAARGSQWRRSYRVSERRRALQRSGEIPSPDNCPFRLKHAEEGRVRRSDLGASPTTAQALGDHYLDGFSASRRHRPRVRSWSDFLSSQAEQLGNIDLYGGMPCELD